MAEVKMNQAVEKLAESTRDSYTTVVDHTVGLQERNVRFAQDMVEGSVRELRQQAERNRKITEDLVDKAEKQREAAQALVEESVDAYMNLLYAPLAYYKEGLEAVKRAR